MRLPPVEVIAKWPTPNYENPITRGPTNIVLNCIMFPFVCAVVGLRIYTRIRISKSFGPDDWLIIAAIPFVATFASLIMVSEIEMQWNRHIWDVRVKSIAQVEMGLKILLVAQLMFGISSTLIKLSMLSLTYRILASASSRLRPWITAAFVMIALGGVLFCCLVVLQCAPDISKYWKITFEDQHCPVYEPKHILAAGILSAITDLIVVLLPIPTVIGVKMPFRVTLIVLCLFGAGFLATGVGAARIYFTRRVNLSNDKTWDVFPSNVTSLIELYIGIICASIPATKKFFSKCWPHILHTHTNTPSFSSETSFNTPPEHDTIEAAINPTYHRHKLSSSIHSMHGIQHSPRNSGAPPSLTIKEEHGIRVDTVLWQTTYIEPAYKPEPNRTLTASIVSVDEMSHSPVNLQGFEAKESNENLVKGHGRKRASSGTLGSMGPFGIYRMRSRGERM